MNIGVGEFKARCLGLLDELHQEGGQIVLTKRGQPIARVVPIQTKLESLENPLAGVVMRPDWR
jgi:prevent-host-death family protein